MVMEITRNKEGMYCSTVGVKIDGRWTTKRIKESTRAKLKDLAASIALANSQGIILPEDYRLLDFIEVYTRTYISEEFSTSTHSNYRLSFENINDFLGNPKLAQITPLQYQEFLNELGKHYARNTVDTRHKKLRAMFNKAVTLKIIPFSPTHGAIMTGKDVAYKKIQFVDSHLITPLVDDITSSFSVARGMIFLAIQTGLRYGELAALSWFDIDFNTKIINVNKSWDHQAKKYVSTKNTERRRVYMDDTTIDYLKAYKKWFDFEFINIENKRSLLFCTNNNNPISNAGANKVLKESFRQLTGCTVTLHKLRHTHIVQCFEAGMDIIYVSERAGHKDINTTMKYYNHVSTKIRTLNENRTSEQFSRKLSILNL